MQGKEVERATSVRELEGGKDMESKARMMGHPIHPILIPFPLGLLTTSVVFDVVHLVTGSGQWLEISFWMIAAGVIGGLVAAVFGLIDWLAIPSGTRAKAVGLWHGASSVLMVILFAASWLLRAGAPGDPGAVAIILSFVGVGLASLGGFLGESWSSVWAWGWPKGRTSMLRVRSPGVRRRWARAARGEWNKEYSRRFTKGVEGNGRVRGGS